MSSGDDPNNGGADRRKSRRLRHVGESEPPNKSEPMLGADLNEANILPGKRHRQVVDYRKLNDCLFGELSEKERAQIDYAEEFKAAKRRPKNKDATEQ
jgi:hypothetical protein